MAINIGIAGSSFNLTEEEIGVARALGKKIAGSKSANLFICYDNESFPMEAGKEALQSREVTCFVTDKDEELKAKNLGFKTINLNLPRMFREIVFINNVDLLIVCGGGSGTLMEVTFAYQLNKKIFVLNEVRGSIDVFKDKYLDKRERIKIESISLEDLEGMISNQNNTFKFKGALL